MAGIFGTIIFGSIAVIAATFAVVCIVAAGKGIYDVFKK